MADGQFFSMFADFFIPAIFTCVLILIVVIIIKEVKMKNKNDQAPILSVEACIVSKRTQDTWYYVTFEVESGDRIELMMSGVDYGMSAEGDEGKLTFQGARFISFERDDLMHMKKMQEEEKNS